MFWKKILSTISFDTWDIIDQRSETSTIYKNKKTKKNHSNSSLCKKTKENRTIN